MHKTKSVQAAMLEPAKRGEQADLSRSVDRSWTRSGPPSQNAKRNAKQSAMLTTEQKKRSVSVKPA